MPQFRSIPSYGSFDDYDEQSAMEEQSSPVVPTASMPPFRAFPTISPSPIIDGATQPRQTAPLLIMTGQQPVVTTEQLEAIKARTGQLQLDTSTAPSLLVALQATIPSATTGRLTVIPAETKRTRALHVPGQRERKRSTEQLPGQRRRMNPRLRHSIIITTILAVFILTLVSLAPLDNGQSTFHIFSGVGNWTKNGQFNWFFQSQMQQAKQNGGQPSGNKQAPAPPAMMLPQSQYIAIAQQDAANAGISPTYFVRQINLESGFNPNAVSPAGAVGIAQFLPSTAAGLGINPYDPIQALRGAANLMANYSRQYGGDYAKALAAYNGGPGTVQYATNTCGANWLNCLPGETRHYIYVIMGI